MTRPDSGELRPLARTKGICRGRVRHGGRIYWAQGYPQPQLCSVSLKGGKPITHGDLPVDAWLLGRSELGWIVRLSRQGPAPGVVSHFEALVEFEKLRDYRQTKDTSAVASFCELPQQVVRRLERWTGTEELLEDYSVLPVRDGYHTLIANCAGLSYVRHDKKFKPRGGKMLVANCPGVSRLEQDELEAAVQRFYNPSARNTVIEQFRCWCRLLPTPARYSRADRQWVCQGLAGALSSSHCHIRLQGVKRRSTTELRQWTLKQWAQKCLEQTASNTADLGSGPGAVAARYLHLCQLRGPQDRLDEEVGWAGPGPLLLDLRYHPGGNRSQDWLAQLGMLPDQTLAWEVHSSGRQQAYPGAIQSQAVAPAPLVVILNQWTRSDAEILAWALWSLRKIKEAKIAFLGSPTAGQVLGRRGPKRRIWLPEYAVNWIFGQVGWLEGRPFQPDILLEPMPGETQDQSDQRHLQFAWQYLQGLGPTRTDR